jgi:hypothetical protein
MGPFNGEVALVAMMRPRPRLSFQQFLKFLVSIFDQLLVHWQTRKLAEFVGPRPDSLPLAYEISFCAHTRD